jgi:hypothetical protein
MAAPEDLSHRRKRLLVDPKFQALFAIYTVATTVIVLPIFIAVDLYFFNLFAFKAREIGIPADSELFNFVGRQQLLIFFVFSGASLLAIVFNVFVSYVVSNKIAGTMYRLKNAFNQAEDLKSAKKITPRKFDFFRDVVDAYNALVDRSN